MVNSKPVYQSRTVWFGALIAASAGYTFFTGGDLQNAMESVAGILTIVFRVLASQKVVL